MVKVGSVCLAAGQSSQEISRNLGAYTQFFVVCEIQVEDCGAAEIFIERWLTGKGYRVTLNGDFFSAPVREVVSAILNMPKYFISPLSNCTDDHFELMSRNDPDELLSLVLSEAPAWRRIWEEAESLYYGLGDSFEDLAGATVRFKDAARLGCSLAYYRLGEIYSNGEEPSDRNTALMFLKEGVKKGNYLCYLEMASIFVDARVEENAIKCLALFLRDRRDKRDTKVEDELDVLMHLSFFLSSRASLFERLSRTHHRSLLKESASELQSELLEAAEIAQQRGSEEQAQRYLAAHKSVLRWL
jgi:hypothetical protein